MIGDFVQSLGELLLDNPGELEAIEIRKLAKDSTQETFELKVIIKEWQDQ